jgi:hypothetical protein
MRGRFGPSILVPVLGGDIGPAVFARARAISQAQGARLAIVHVVRGDDDTDLQTRGGNQPMPRWRRLAEFATSFVDGVEGDPATVILSQARRFHSDVVLLGPPAAPSAAAWAAEAIARVQRAAPNLVEVVGEAARRPGMLVEAPTTGIRPQFVEV